MREGRKGDLGIFNGKALSFRVLRDICVNLAQSLLKKCIKYTVELQI